MAWDGGLTGQPALSRVLASCPTLPLFCRVEFLASSEVIEDLLNILTSKPPGWSGEAAGALETLAAAWGPDCSEDNAPYKTLGELLTCVKALVRTECGLSRIALTAVAIDAMRSWAAAGSAPVECLGRAITGLLRVAELFASDGGEPGGPACGEELAALHTAAALACDWARRQSGTLRQVPRGIIEPGEGLVAVIQGLVEELENVDEYAMGPNALSDWSVLLFEAANMLDALGNCRVVAAQMAVTEQLLPSLLEAGNWAGAVPAYVLEDLHMARIVMALVTVCHTMSRLAARDVPPFSSHDRVCEAFNERSTSLDHPRLCAPAFHLRLAVLRHMQAIGGLTEMLRLLVLWRTQLAKCAMSIFTGPECDRWIGLVLQAAELLLAAGLQRDEFVQSGGMAPVADYLTWYASSGSMQLPAGHEIHVLVGELLAAARECLIDEDLDSAETALNYFNSAGGVEACFAVLQKHPPIAEVVLDRSPDRWGNLKNLAAVLEVALTDNMERAAEFLEWGGVAALVRLLLKDGGGARAAHGSLRVPRATRGAWRISSAMRNVASTLSSLFTSFVGETPHPQVGVWHERLGKAMAGLLSTSDLMELLAWEPTKGANRDFDSSTEGSAASSVRSCYTLHDAALNLLLLVTSASPAHAAAIAASPAHCAALLRAANSQLEFDKKKEGAAGGRKAARSYPRVFLGCGTALGVLGEVISQRRDVLPRLVEGGLLRTLSEAILGALHSAQLGEIMRGVASVIRGQRQQGRSEGEGGASWGEDGPFDEGEMVEEMIAGAFEASRSAAKRVLSQAVLLLMQILTEGDAPDKEICAELMQTDLTLLFSVPGATDSTPLGTSMSAQSLAVVQAAVQGKDVPEGAGQRDYYSLVPLECRYEDSETRDLFKTVLGMLGPARDLAAAAAEERERTRAAEQATADRIAAELMAAEDAAREKERQAAEKKAAKRQRQKDAKAAALQAQQQAEAEAAAAAAAAAEKAAAEKAARKAKEQVAAAAATRKPGASGGPPGSLNGAGQQGTGVSGDGGEDPPAAKKKQRGKKKKGAAAAAEASTSAQPGPSTAQAQAASAAAPQQASSSGGGGGSSSSVAAAVDVATTSAARAPVQPMARPSGPAPAQMHPQARPVAATPYPAAGALQAAPPFAVQQAYPSGTQPAYQEPWQPTAQPSGPAPAQVHPHAQPVAAAPYPAAGAPPAAPSFAVQQSYPGGTQPAYQEPWQPRSSSTAGGVGSEEDPEFQELLVALGMMPAPAGPMTAPAQPELPAGPGGSVQGSEHLPSAVLAPAGGGAGGDARAPARGGWTGIPLAAVLACPLTGRLLEDPVLAPDGHTFERSALDAWVAAHGFVSPLTGAPWAPGLLPRPNLAVRDLLGSL